MEIYYLVEIGWEMIRENWDYGTDWINRPVKVIVSVYYYVRTTNFFFET